MFFRETRNTDVVFTQEHFYFSVVEEGIPLP